ncbi:LytTR family DNA-binding domain-containing protein [Chitinophaga sp.]|uniref:LytR/AlgR family response regulator transcription factor n=1 Tax=Chitinophaga sp. TaxID=1869181 RepID=UPI0031E310EF
MKLNIIITDDEPNAVNLLEVLICQTTDWQIVAKCFNGLEALQAVKQHKTDLIFLDINMPLLDGMSLAALLPAGIKIVFTTAYSEFAADSYNYSAIDYLLKPITLKRFLDAQKKIEAAFENGKNVVDNGYFFAKTGKTIKKVPVNDILYAESEKEYVKLVLEKENILVYRRLKEIEEMLTLPFLRIHHSFIINLDHLQQIQDNHVYIGNKRIPVSDKYNEAFWEVINRKKI